MKKQNLVDAVGKIDDSFIEATAKTRIKKRKNVFIKIIAMAACFSLIVTGVFYGINNGDLEPALNAFAIEEAVYPEMAPSPITVEQDYDSTFELWENWRNEGIDRQNLVVGHKRSLDSFIEKSLPALFEGTGKENRVISPLNIYMALSVLTELTDGESRQQLLDLIGAESTEELRKQTNDLWNSVYRDDGADKCLLSNSVWLDKNLEYNRETLKMIAENYFASSFSGKMGSEEYNKALQKWLNEQTGGLLEEYVSGEEMSSDTVFALASTIYFSVKWNDIFQKNNNTKNIFHGAEGDTEVTFMNENTIGDYYFCDGFSAVEKPFTQFNGSMWFIRPDDSTEVSSLMENIDFQNLVSGKSKPKSERAVINLSVPKFDINSGRDISEALQNLGVNDIFNPDKSDFSPALESSGVSVGKMNHCARILIDEEGCEAAAYTLDMNAGGPIEPDLKVDFTLDKPFIVLIKSATGLPLFVGVVNTIG